jgi:hypothetical protein
MARSPIGIERRLVRHRHADGVTWLPQSKPDGQADREIERRVEPDDGVMEETVVPFDADRETLVDSRLGG